MLGKWVSQTSEVVTVTHKYNINLFTTFKAT